MKPFALLILALFIASPAFGQGLTVTMTQTDSKGTKTPQILQTDSTRARLDLPNGSKLLYNSETKMVQVMFAGTTVYTQLTPQLIQILSAAAGQGQPSAIPITYKRMGSSKVGQWPCTTYEGYRGSEKVAELCAADGAGIAMAAGDFVMVQQAVDSVKKLISQEVLDGIPTWGAAAVQGFIGFPVRRTTFVNGKPDTTVDLNEFRRGPIPAANFAVPTAAPTGGRAQ